MIMLDSNEIKEVFNKNNRVFWFFRDLWDGYRYRRNKDWSFVSIIQELQKQFPDLEYVKDKKPLRSFKIYSTVKEEVTKEMIYNDWRQYLTETVYLKNGTRTTLNEQIMIHAKRKAREESKGYTEQQLMIAFCTMLWRCAEGVMLEVKAVKKLQKDYSMKNVTIDFAPDERENSGTDCTFTNILNKHQIDVSIKCLGSLNPQTAKYLLEKDKEVLFLCGFINPDDDHLTFYILDEKKSHVFFKNVIKIKDNENVHIV